MTDHAHELRRYARKIAHPAVMLAAAADEIERLRTESAGLVDDMNLLRDNNTALRAKVEAVERQEPVAWCATDETGTVIEALGMNQSRRFDTALYLAPGAQPAPSVPSVPDDRALRIIHRTAGHLRLLKKDSKTWGQLHHKTKRAAELLHRDIDAMLAAAPEAKP